MKLNYRRTICVGFAFFLITAFWQAYDSIIPKILTDKFGMSQTWSGVIMALDNVLALFLLPLFGALSDKSKSKHGRRTPYIVAGTVAAAAAFFALSFADGMQLTNISAVSDINSAASLETLYEYDYSTVVKTPDGDEFVVTEIFTKEDFLNITSSEDCAATLNEDGTYSVATWDTSEHTSEDSVSPYTQFVVPLRQAYAWEMTLKSPVTLVFFIVLLLLCLLSMATFRSPAVALMPDVTIKPLRSKGNAVINLMGTVGGIIVLVLGVIFGTGKTENALMSYTGFFACISGIMLIALGLFIITVNEPKFVREMHEESRKYGIDVEDNSESADNTKSHKLSKSELTSLILILASVVLWFFGYNAVTSKYSVYAGSVLGLDYNMTLIIAQAAAIVSYIPVGIISSKVGRKRVIQAGIIMLAVAFFAASFMREGSSAIVLNVLFSLAGIGWASINVNSFPMVVELSKNSDVGKYTGFYYTASMAAQTIMPIFSGVFLDIKMTTLFPYATIFVVLSFVTISLVKHGDSKPDAAGSALESFSDME
ncbi:MAG: MFS transporter [Firmicutes bacterium]|nr:MFS transporter [Bacillota bacterium]